VPDGWTVSGSEFALVTSRPGVTTSPDDFQEARRHARRRHDRHQRRGSRHGRHAHGTISREGDTTILLWSLPDGRVMDVQAPDRCTWDTATSSGSPSP
jgi:hypothetical protein